ncbi:MAG: DedA family protein [Pirellulales bacterium]
MPDLLPYLLPAILLILTGSGLPIPEEAIVVGAGVAASLGTINPWGGVLACILGALLGDLLAYYIGRRFGRGMLQKRSWFARLMHADRERQIEEMISRHGLKVFFLARFLVGLRAPIYLTAGILRVPVRKFLLIDTISALVVIGLFYGLAFRYGETVGKWIHTGEIWVTVTVVVGCLGAAIAFWIVHQRRKRAASLDDSAATGNEHSKSDKIQNTTI